MEPGFIFLEATWIGDHASPVPPQGDSMQGIPLDMFFPPRLACAGFPEKRGYDD
jgi:hypothetical protein